MNYFLNSRLMPNILSFLDSNNTIQEEFKEWMTRYLLDKFIMDLWYL